MSSFDISVIKRNSLELKDYYLEPIESGGADLCSDHAELLAIFETKTNGERMLRRSDFRPEELKPYLANIVMIEPVLDDGGNLKDARFRLMGSATATAYGEMTGKLASEYAGAEVAARFFEGVGLALKHKKAIVGHARSDMPDALVGSSPAPHADVFFVPLSDDNEQIDQILLHVTLE